MNTNIVIASAKNRSINLASINTILREAGICIANRGAVKCIMEKLNEVAEGWQHVEAKVFMGSSFHLEVKDGDLIYHHGMPLVRDFTGGVTTSFTSVDDAKLMAHRMFKKRFERNYVLESLNDSKHNGYILYNTNGYPAIRIDISEEGKVDITVY